MALLQISEPGQSPNPHQRKIAIGIDLGTTHSLVAAVRNGVAECLPDEAGKVILPSVVHYRAFQSRLIGLDAVQAGVQDPANTIRSFKRLMGRSASDMASHAHHLPYQLLDAPGMVQVQTVAGPKSPIELSAEILATLRQRAEDTFNDDIFGAVITVPAYFDDAQRQATKDAAEMAGLHVLRLINEPTAAAIAYGLDNASEGLFAVYDLGGGTFDVSLLRLSQGVFEVVATGGNSALGGDDYDQALATWVLAQNHQQQLVLSAQEKGDMAAQARQVKEQLSSQDSAIFSLQLSSGLIQQVVSRLDFEAATSALTQQTLTACKKVLRDANVSAQDVQGVVMVGGSTRMPHIPSAVGQLFQCPVLTNVNPDEVVALGAAISAHQLAGNAGASDLLLLDVIPLSLGLETMGGLVERIVPRNQTIPTAMAQDFTTYQDGQTALALHVVQGERDLVTDCRSLAKFTLRGIPPMAAGAARIRVTFTVDADGLLSVSAIETGSGVEAKVQVKPSYGLTDEQIAQMLADSFHTAEQDIETRALVEAQVDADRLILATQSALNKDGDLLSEPEQQQIKQLIDNLALIRQGTHAKAIEDSMKELAKGTEQFAAERMNRGISQALSGKAIESI